MTGRYVHGYDPREAIRLRDQASTLAELLHCDTAYPPGSRVLEAGCGVGGQTVSLARNSPGARILAVDIAWASLVEARKRLRSAGSPEIGLIQGNIFDLPFRPGTFDHVFLCFVLEHLSEPAAALRRLKALLKTGGTITAIEGDHGSTFFHPHSEAALRAIRCQVELQRRAGGNAMIGRQLYPLLQEAGFEAVRVSPRMVYVDSSRPALVDGFTRKTFTAMIEGVREAAIGSGLTSAADFDRGVVDLYRTAASDGVFCYTFFKAVAKKGVGE
ncbi:MAG: methyltransferase domain-containing protein [Desulfobacterales bacterium]|jgi:ubiquinone/menaquinone biosynthesis C-methylase UbiE